MASIRNTKKFVKKSIRLQRTVSIVIKDESEEDGNTLWLSAFAGSGVQFTKFSIVSTWCDTPIVAVPYWRIGIIKSL